jgi:isopenicillin-N epimerase
MASETTSEPRIGESPLAATRFGASLRDRWAIDPAISYLNHGTVGAPPKAVLDHQRSLVDEIERQPARFMLRELADVEGRGSGRTPRMREAATAVAGFVGLTQSDELVFVENITSGANAVLRSFPFRSGDELAVTSLGYGGVTNAARFAARDRDCTLRTIELPRPGTPAEQFVDAVATGLSPSTRLLIIDHITASTALILPLREIAEVCHRRGVVVLADGAHVPGNIPLDISTLGVDFYTGNLHKWAWAPRSSAILWAAPEHRPQLHPTVISWGLDNGLAAEFDLLGTRDPSPFLTAPFAIEHMHSYGLDAIFAYNHELAWWAGQYLSDRWDTLFATPESMIGSMVTVRLPERLGSSPDEAERVRSVLEQGRIEVPVYATPTGLETRISAQIYCERADIERLADAVIEIADS